MLAVHTHYDHALDTAAVAQRTGAVVVGGASAANTARGQGLSEDRIVVAQPGAKASAYRCGEAWSTLMLHRPSGRRLPIQGSAGFVPGALAGRRAEVAYLGVGQLGIQPQPDPFIRQYRTETVRAVGARRVVLIHWDDLFRPLTEPVRAFPYAVDPTRGISPV